MRPENPLTFHYYVCLNDTVSIKRDGITYTVRVEHDPCYRIDDDDVHDPKRARWDGESAEQYARTMEARAAYLRGEWFYVGLVVSAERDGWVRDHVASLWGIEANYPGTRNEYLGEVAAELIEEAAAELSEACSHHDADECAMARERSVAGVSDTVPECLVHDRDGPEDAMGGEILTDELLDFVAWLDDTRPDTFADLWAEFQDSRN
jgi:hypothetical protein